MVRYALTIFLSAFLLFQVQPLIGKHVLPWFGGGPAVWSTCMLFFQMLLLLGYACAHFLSTRLKARTHGWVHIGLLGIALLFLPIAPAKPGVHGEPTRQILLLLLVTVGGPYLLLASTGPLLQRWFSFSFPGRSPYRLYALSNVGSLLALLSYPFLVEPLLTLERQVSLWSACFIAFALLSAWCAFSITRLKSTSDEGSPPEGTTDPGTTETTGDVSDTGEETKKPATDAPGLGTLLLWLLLAAFGSSMLLATTNQLCQEVAVIPFLWILPLSLYLVTFIICFDSERWYDRRVFAPLFVASMPLACLILHLDFDVNMWLQVAAYSLILFACCMMCHGELVRSKPGPRYLTLFYLLIAAGGALGGVFVALVAPRVLHDFWEYHLALFGCALLAVVTWLRPAAWRNVPRLFYLQVGLPVAIVLLAGVAVLGKSLHLHTLDADDMAIYKSRNFYGVLRVTQYDDGHGGLMRSLRHGRILHGNQFIESERRIWATTYYGAVSGIGLALAHHPRRYAVDVLQRSLRVGVVGLGTGTIAVHGKPGDLFRFYEINPEVDRVSDSLFSFREDSGATVEVVLGDARLSLEQELARNEFQKFDVLAIDAFSSDAIPIHLLTAECAEIYWQHLRPDGLLLIHISNRYLNLNPVTRALAQHLNCTATMFDCEEDEDTAVDSATWVVLTDNKLFLNQTDVHEATQEWPDDDPPPLLWTDNFAGLWQVLDFGGVFDFD